MGALRCQRVRPLWITGLLILAVFALFRAALLVAKWSFIRGVGPKTVAWCFLVGMRYDGMPLGYLLLPMALLLSLAPSAWFARRRFRGIAGAYAAGAMTVVTVVEIIGVAFFWEYISRLNWIAVTYPSHREIRRYLWNNYPVLLLAMGPVVLFLLFRWLLRRMFWRGAPAVGFARGRAILAPVLVGLCVLACRGGAGRRPLRRGSGYISTNNLVSQLTMNNFYTFFQAAKSTINDTEDEKGLYAMPDVQEAAEVVRGMIAGGDHVLDHESNPLWRRTETYEPRRDYNVVVIIMEGMSSRPVGALGYRPSHTPCLDALCREGLFFENMYAVGARTNRAMLGVLCGHPDLGGVTVMKREPALQGFLTLPAILRRRGYRTEFLYGGDPNFDNMRGFFSRNGIQDVLGQEEMGLADEARRGNWTWGMPDEYVFDYALRRFDAHGGARFFSAILTVSNHQPYQVPEGGAWDRLVCDVDDEAQRRRIQCLNAYRYADWALGRFLDEARYRPWFSHTVFVLVADHGRHKDFRPDRLVDVPAFRIPCLFYAPGIIPPGRARVVCSQTDIPPTIMGFLGGWYDHSFLGRDVRSLDSQNPDDGFALLHLDERLAFVRGDEAMVMHPIKEEADPAADAGLFRILWNGARGEFDMIQVRSAYPDDRRTVAARRREMLSLYRMALHLYEARAYHPPRAAPGGVVIEPVGSDLGVPVP